MSEHDREIDKTAGFTSKYCMRFLLPELHTWIICIRMKKKLIFNKFFPMNHLIKVDCSALLSNKFHKVLLID